MAPSAPPNPTKQPPPPLPRQEKRIALTRDFVGFHGSIEIGIKLSLSCGASNLSRQARKIGCSTRPNRIRTRAAERVGERARRSGKRDGGVFGVSHSRGETNGSNLARARQIFRCRLKSCRGFPLPIEAIHAETPIRRHATSLAAFNI